MALATGAGVWVLLGMGGLVPDPKPAKSEILAAKLGYGIGGRLGKSRITAKAVMPVSLNLGVA
jgi:hypothetical protein